MDRRTKILTAVFGSIIGYAFLAQVVYPRWIKPLLTLDERIAKRQEELTKLENEEDQVERAKADYIHFMERDGGTDVARVALGLRKKLFELIAKHGLTGETVTSGRETTDAKNDLTRMPFDVTAEAPLPAVISFLKEIAELPQLIRVGNVQMTRVTASRTARDATDRVSLNLPLELLVVPQNKKVGLIEESKLKRPENRVRHLGRNYSAIWDRKPFTEYEADKAISITMKPKSFAPKVGAVTQLQAMVSGGNGEIKYQWSPEEGLLDTKSLTPKVDTSTAGNRVYTLTVTDARGKSASETVTVNVQEPPPERPAQPQPVETPPTPVKVAAKPWPDGKSMQISQIWTTFAGGARADELAVNNVKTRCTDYYKVGDGFDGGELVFLHQHGAVVRRNDEYWLYPIGAKLDEAVTEEEGLLHPDLQDAAKRHRMTQAPVDREKKESASKASAGSGFPPVLIGPSAAADSLVGPPFEANQPPAPAVETAEVGPPAPSAVGAGTVPPDAANPRAKPKRAGALTGGAKTPARKGTTQPSGGTTNDPKGSTPEKSSEKTTPPVPE